MRKKFIFAGIALGAVLSVGTIGYWFIGDKHHSLLDSLYMTIITISTIGYGEIISLTGNPGGRLFTIFVALSGIGVLFYMLTNFTAFVVEGELKDSFWRRKMEKMAGNLEDHFIVCGAGSVGAHIVNELDATKRPYVIVDVDKSNIEKLSKALRSQIIIEDDATDNSTLLRAGIDKAIGLFAVTGDDNQNLVICLTAKQLKPDVKVVAECYEIKNIEKMKKAGADAVVSPNFIGGLRMASEMVRPTVVSFLDMMLRDKEKNWRIEEMTVPSSFAGKPISAVDLGRCHSLLLLAVRTTDGVTYNPPADFVLEEGNSLIFMSTPEDKHRLGRILSP